MLEHIEGTFNYRIVRLIAKGGMGSVYEAMQLGADGFEKRVAIKTLLPALSHNRRFVDMFIGEAKLVADLVHENIVQIYQLGHSFHGYFIVMEYVHGLSLEEFIHFHAVTGERLPRELAVFITSRIARGLAYAHSRVDGDGGAKNIVHRDVCPNNVLITTEGLPKLGDFGIAKAANSAIPQNDRSLMGKLLYMSPEQAQRKLVDHRADIYALGMLLFELLALQRARAPWFREAHDAAKDGRVDWDCLPDDINDNVMGILKRTLSVDPGERYSDTDKLAYDLEYHIYHKGYGPTVVTLEKYLQKHFPYLTMRQRTGPAAADTPTAKADHTVVVPDLQDD